MEYGLVVLWLLTYLLLGVAGLPVATVLLGRLPDRGASVALPLSLSVLTLVALWVGRVAFGWPTLLAGALVLGGLSVVAMRRYDATPDWGVAGETALVFGAAFLFLVAVRAYDPAVHPVFGEKFLDFGILKSLLRSETLPPEDMWFAGEPVAYYYGGHLVTALLSMLTGTAPKFAYNLALAGFYAMYVTGAFGVGGAIAAARGASRRVGGVAAVFFVGVASNLETPMMTLLGLLPADLAMDLATTLEGDEEAARELLAGAENFGYFGASRVIDGTINEFPIFAWLNGDLHAHMMSTPFMLLLVALLFAYFRTPESAVGRRRTLVFGAVPLVGGLLGVVNTWSFPSVMGLSALALLFAPTDPATLLPGGLTDRLRSGGARLATDGDGATEGGAAATEDGSDLTPGERLAGVARREAVRVLVAGGLAVGVQLLALAVVLPFFLGPASTRGIATLPDRSALGELLMVHGTFLAVVATYFASKARIEDGDTWLGVVGGVAALVVLGAWSGFAAIGLFAPVLLAAWALARGEADVGFEAVLVAGAVGLAMAVELVYVNEQAGPERMNTVFKTYAQVWLFFAVAAGGMAADLVGRYEGREPWALATGVVAVGALRIHDEPWLTALVAGAAVAALTWYALEAVDVRSLLDDGVEDVDAALAVNLVLAVFVVTTSVYAGLALDAHFAGDSIYPRYQTADDPTLDATQFVAEGHPAEAKAITWMDDNIEGQPTIVTGVPAGYFWNPIEGKGSSAPASLTGIPSVLGWFHEVGYRGREPYQERKRDVRTIYLGDPNESARLLAAYDVTYVYFGPAERSRYGSLALDVTVDDVPGVTVHRRWEAENGNTVTLFRVDQSKLPATNASAG